MKKLGKFEIIEKVGQGAMGVVYKARDPLIGRIVALKTLTTGLAEDPNLLKRFYTEARSAGGLQHPNIVTIYELGHEGSTPFIAMQFLDGKSLDKIIDRRPRLPLSQKIGFIVHVCRALEYAHRQTPPLIHRDIKPGNVMVTTEGAVVVVDFGIARLGEGTRSQSAGMLIGTLGYMSPQLFRNGAADARSDIWATGVMFYELLAYRRPFEGDNAAALMSNIILEKPRSLAEAAPGTPADIQIVLDRMLAKELDARYQTMEEVLLELEPVWRRLQQIEVRELLEVSQQLFESGELETARERVSQILKIDTSNTLAKSLHEKIITEIRRKQIIPQLKERVERAETFLANGKLEDAKAEVVAVLKLDSTFLPAREFLRQLEAAIERSRQIDELIHTSKKRMAEGALTEAELQLDKVVEMDPANAAARELGNQLREQRRRRERKKQRDELLDRARTLWAN
jgi:serine/threonine protein kinase